MFYWPTTLIKSKLWNKWALKSWALLKLSSNPIHLINLISKLKLNLAICSFRPSKKCKNTNFLLNQSSLSSLTKWCLPPDLFIVLPITYQSNQSNLDVSFMKMMPNSSSKNTPILWPRKFIMANKWSNFQTLNIKNLTPNCSSLIGPMSMFIMIFNHLKTT